MATDTPLVDPEAPFGRKKDGTPRRRAAWQDDPEKVEQARRTRVRNRAARDGGLLASTETSAITTEPDDMLSRHRREWDERMAELAPLVEEYQRLEQAFDALNTV